MSNTEVVDVKTGEVLPTDEKMALVRAEPLDSLTALVKESDRPVFGALANVNSLDWRNLPPNVMAFLLTQKPYTAGGGTTYLNLRQAMLFALRAYELGLSPLSDNVWFDSNRGTTNVTLSGKRELARLRGLDLGPPVFEDLTRPWDTVPKITQAGEEARKSGFTSDVGSKCTIRVGDPKNNESVSFTAWLNDWYQPRSPVWKEKYSHMLAVRANEKALTLMLGTGISQMPDDKELD